MRPKQIRPVVTIIQKVMPHYRVPFFAGLKQALSVQGIDLRLLVGQPDNVTGTRNDAGTLSWCEVFENRYIPLGRRHVIWQPVVRASLDSDLVIVEHASKLLANYALMARRRSPGGPRLAFWGHGRNFDTTHASRIAEIGKRALGTEADWWFCYTEGTAGLVEAFGVDRREITVVQNTTDTASLRRAREAISVEDIASVRAELGIGDGPVAVSIGSIYPTKRPAFLLAAADHLRQMIPGFELIVLGDGPDRHLLDSAAISRRWLHVLGAVHGDDVARWASPASVLLNPGVVGLTIVDAFALGLPIVTCDIDGHGPEVEYLENGVNGLMLDRDTTTQQYATEVARLMDDHSQLRNLSCNAAEAAGRYTMDEMVARFAQGVLAALSARRAEKSIVQAVRRRRRRWTS